MNHETLQEAKKSLDSILFSGKPKEQILLDSCQYLSTTFDYYHWVGFYFADSTRTELHLGPYVGAPTEHIRIPFGRGICGQVALTNKSLLVSDVQASDNYLACSIETRSEIVVPIIQNGENIGQIDVDSHQLNAFSEKDQQLLEYLTHNLAQILSSASS